MAGSVRVGAIAKFSAKPPLIYSPTMESYPLTESYALLLGIPGYPSVKSGVSFGVDLSVY